MAIKEMSDAECRQVLARAQFGRLGCALENQPYVVPISVVYEPDYLYSFSTLGQKIEWMRTNPRVCVQIDEITDQSQWISVVVTGSYQELREPQFEMERAHARKLLDRKQHWWLNAFAERQSRVGDELIAPLFYRIQIESVSGLMSSGSA